MLRRLAESIGRRGAALFVLAAIDLAYGSAIVYARAHSSVRGPSAGWWPASQSEVLLIPTQAWGWVWIVVGLGLLSGVGRRADRWHYTVATGLKAFWACAAMFSLFLPGQTPGLWGITAFYIGFATLVFIVTGWPEPAPPHDEEPT